MKEKFGVLLLIGVFFVLGIIIDNPFVLNMLSLSAITVIVVIGLNLLLGFTGQVSLGHAGFVAMGAYGAAILSIYFDLLPWVSIIVTAIGTVIFAVIIAYPTLRLKGHYLAMATLAIGEMIYILLNNLVEITGGHQGLTGIPMLTVGKFAFDSEKKFYFFIWFVVLFMAFVALNLANSHFGRALRTIKQKESAALSFGINVHWYKVLVFGISALYASVAGSLYAFYLGFISPLSFNLVKSIDYIVMVFVGGMESIFGSIVMAVTLEIIPNIATSLEDYWPLVNGLLLVVMVMFLPKGIGGLIRWKRNLF